MKKIVVISNNLDIYNAVRNLICEKGFDIIVYQVNERKPFLIHDNKPPLITGLKRRRSDNIVK